MRSPQVLHLLYVVVLGLLVLPHPWKDHDFSSLYFKNSLEAQNDDISSSSLHAVHHDIRKVNTTGIIQRTLPGNKVFMTGPYVPEELLQANLALNSNLEFHLFNNSAMARSVMLINKQLQEQANVTGAWNAWKSLHPWAFRADLWRYMILWSTGGIYIDAKVKLTAPISVWAALGPNETASVCYDNEITWNSTKYGNVPALQVSTYSARKGSPVLLEAIKLVIQNVQHKSYLLVGEESSLQGNRHACLSVSGPILFGYAAQVGDENTRVRLPCKCHHGLNGCFLEGEGTLAKGQVKVMETDHSEHEQVHALGNTYGDLWAARKAYCNDDEPAAAAAAPSWQAMSEKEQTPCNIQALLPELCSNSSTHKPGAI